ncbi:hypothetical protein EPUL_005719, partial [Erysiphe pulchra]
MKPLTIMQANDGRGHSSHNLALQLAHENNFDIIMIQEPWTFRDLTRKQTISHTRYKTFSPLSTWSTRPRVLTYVRKTQELRPYQESMDLSGDLLQLMVITDSGRKLRVWNIYNAPPSSTGAGNGLSMLLNSNNDPFFVGGDFNLKHPSWDSITSYASPQSSELINWANQKNVSLLNPTGVPTHRAGGTIDLAFCSQLGATCKILSDLQTTSDHETLLSIIPNIGNLKDFEGRLRYKSLDEKLFSSILTNCDRIPHLESSNEVEKEAKEITLSIRSALNASCPRT